MRVRVTWLAASGESWAEESFGKKGKKERVSFTSVADDPGPMCKRGHGTRRFSAQVTPNLGRRQGVA
jgi:hypothetical protein